MAIDTGRQLCGSCTQAVDRASGNWAMALVAQLVDVWHIQQAGILRSVGCVASDAAFSAHSSVFVDERAARLGMALGADRVLIGSDLEIGGLERAVNVMAVAAGHEAFIHLVVEGHRERRLDAGVAAIAEGRLRRH